MKINPMRADVLSIELPKVIVDQVQASFRQVVALLETRAPSAVFILERSATLPAQKHINYLTEHYPDVPILYLPIGQIVPMMFMDVEAFDLDIAVNSLGSNLELYQTWLRDTDNPYIAHLRRQIVAGLGDCAHETMILVIDDAVSIGEHSGETIGLTTPMLIHAAMGKQIETVPHVIFSKSLSGWDSDLFRSANLALSQIEETFLSELIKGTLDMRMLAEDYFGKDERTLETIGRKIKCANETGEYIIDHTDEDFYPLLDAQSIFGASLYAHQSDLESPFASLSKRFGEETIRQLPTHMCQLFKSL